MPEATPSHSVLSQPVGSPLARLFAEPALNGVRRPLTSGQVIFEPDSPAQKLYFIHRGQVRLYQVGLNDARLVEILGADEWFGVGAMAGLATHNARAAAVVPTLVTEVPLDRFNLLMRSRPDQLLELNRQLAAKLQRSRDDAARLVFEDCNARLIRTLLDFSSSAASTQREDHVVLRITHNQLAQAVGVARETVSLALTQLRQQNLLRTGRNQLVFNPESLRQLRSRAPHARPSAPRARGMHHHSHVERVA